MLWIPTYTYFFTMLGYSVPRSSFLFLVLVPVSRLSFSVFSSSRNTCKRKLAKLYMYEEP